MHPYNRDSANSFNVYNLTPSIRRKNQFECISLPGTVISLNSERMKVLETHKRPHNDALSTTIMLQASLVGHQIFQTGTTYVPSGVKGLKD